MYCCLQADVGTRLFDLHLAMTPVALLENAAQLHWGWKYLRH